MKKYISTILLSIFIIITVLILPFLVSKISFKYYFGIVFSFFFFVPLLVINKNDNPIIIKKKYLILILPFFLIYSSFLVITKNLVVIPISLAILASGLISYKLLRFNIYIRLILIIIISYLGYLFYPKYSTELSFQKSKVDEPIPAEIILLNSDSTEINLNKEKLTILEFWNSACSQCIKEFPRFQDFYNENNRKYDIYSVNIPWKRDIENNFNAYELIDSLGFNFPVLISNEKVLKKLGIYAFPTVLVIDKNNRIKYRGRLTYGSKGRYNFKNILNSITNE